MVKRILLLTTLCIVACSCWGQKGVKYIPISDTEATGIFEKKASGRLVIPATVTIKGKQYKVTCFGNLSSKRWTNFGVKELVLPHTVKKIYELGSHTLESVQMPNTVTYIGPRAFAWSKMKEIVLPDSLRRIGREAFMFCSNLEKVSFPASLRRIDYFAFSGSGLVDVIIPNTVDTMLAGVFSSCSKLHSIKVPDKIIYSNMYMKEISPIFYACYDLVDIQGYSRLLPKWVVYDINSIAESNDNLKDKEHGMPPFKSKIPERKTQSYYWCWTEKVYPLYLEWKRKKEFETDAQYNERMSEQNRLAKIRAMYTKGKQTFLTAQAPSSPTFRLMDYDADFGVYKIQVPGYNSIYVKVPESDRVSFQRSWNERTTDDALNYKFDVIKDRIGISELECRINGHVYKSLPVSTDKIPDFQIIPMGGDNVAANSDKPKQKIKVKIDHSIDQNIPIGSADNTNTFAVIIGNEKYQQVMAVPFANNDACIFAEYCKKTLGLPEKNVRLYENATYGAMVSAMSDIQKIGKAYRGDISVIFYYAGHGIPDEATGDSYLLPVDADGINMKVCYPLNQLYKELGDMNVKNVTCFLDACFSGSQRGNGMVIAARGVAIKAKNNQPKGNTVVFTAATDKQTAFPYEEKGHGMFTYYLLKKLRDTKGDCTLGELGSYICDEVSKQAVVTNGKEQTPVVLTSVGDAFNWKNIKLK